MIFSIFLSLAIAQVKTLNAVIFSTDANTYTFTSKRGFHFNVKAPITFKISQEKINPQNATEMVVKFDRQKIEVADKSRQGQFQIYVCDDANTVCEVHSIEHSRLLANKDNHWIEDKVQSSTEGKPKKSAPERMDGGKKASNHNGFIVNDWDQALAKAQKEKKLLFIDFRGSWCPPCIRLESEVFSQRAFQKNKKDFVFLSLDVDREEIYPLMKRFDIKAFPTLIITTAQGNEILRFLDFQNLQYIQEKMKLAKEKKEPIAPKLEAQAQAGDRKSMIELAELLFDSYQYPQAILWYEKANLRNKKYHLARINTLESESEKNPTAYQKALQEALDSFPDSYSSASWNFNLAKSLGEKHKSYSNFMSRGLQIADEWIQDPSRIAPLRVNEGYEATNELELAELYALKGEIYSAIKDEDKAKKAWEKATQEALNTKPSVKKPMHIIHLVYYMKHCRDVEEAVTWLQSLTAAYPTEFTYPYRIANLYFEKDQFTKAIGYSTRALELSYGSNRITSLILHSKILKKLERKEEANRLIQEMLDSPLAKDERNKKSIAKLKDLK